MIIKRKYTYGDGTIMYIEEEIEPPEDDEISAEEALAIISGGVSDEAQ